MHEIPYLAEPRSKCHLHATIMDNLTTVTNDALVTIVLDSITSNATTISKNLLCSASPYFIKALQGKFVEASTQTLRLPGCDEDVFRTLVHYLYNNHTLPDYQAKHQEFPARGASIPGDDYAADTMDLLIRTWAFGEEHLMPDLQNKAMRALLVFLKVMSLNPRMIRRAFEVTSEDSMLRKAIVHEAVYDWKAGNLRDEGQMERLGTIPGLFKIWTSTVARYGGDCTCHNCEVLKDFARPTRGDNWERYMVVTAESG